LGLDPAYAFLGDLGLHEHHRPARHYGYGLALGSLPVTLEQLATAYTALAGDGRLKPLHWVRQEAPRETASEQGRRVISEETARWIALALSDPQARLPSFPRMGFTEYPFPVAVKTGTSSQYRDAWTVAWSERYLVVAWVGHPDYLPMTRLSGYRSAAQLVQGVMTTLHGDRLDGLTDVSFPAPRGFEAHRLCALSGRRATEACDRVVLEWLRPTEVPPDVCRSHVRLAVDRRDGRLATSATPTAAVAVRTFVDLPPHYAPWAAQAGLPRPPSASGARIRRAVPQTAPIRLAITSPEPQARLLRDPEAPPGRSTLALRAVVDPPVEQVVWYVDGRPFQVVPYPYTARWPLAPGEHTFQLRLPFRREASPPVTVLVQ
jgi:penicillin-binding protein 1C